MHQPSTPGDYVLLQLRDLHEQWSAVQDADVEAVHTARVATRRIRAALPFVTSASPATRKNVRRIGRRLGRVRELDVTDGLLTMLESRTDAMPRAIAVLRLEIFDRLDRERREMIKTLEHSPRAIAHAVAHGGARLRLKTLWRDWRQELRVDIQHRADDVASAVHQATAVYMPNRSHAARIAIKKLRYAVEVATTIGLLDGGDLLDDMKKAQDAMGQLNDLRALTKSLDASRAWKQAPDEAATLAAVVEVETARLHEKYLRQRDRLYAVCDACRQRASESGTSRSMRIAARMLPAAGLIALPIAALYVSHHQVRESGRDDSERDARIARFPDPADVRQPTLRPRPAAGW